MVRAGRWCLLGLVVGGAPLAAQTTSPRVLTPGAGTYEAVSRLTALLELILEHHVPAEPVQLAEATTAALEQFVQTVDEEAELLPAVQTPQPDGVVLGALLTRRDDMPLIVSVRDGTTAQRAGLMPGEWITGVNYQPTAGRSLAALRQQLDGVAGAELILELRDAGGSARALRIRREAPRPAPGGLRFLAGGVAYYRLPSLELEVVERLREGIAKAHQEQARGLILDVRNNPGGHLLAVAAAIELFLPGRSPVGSVVYGRGQRRTALMTAYEPVVFQAPVALLINAGTAAEAELLAGALQSHRRAQLFGARTAGRGRVWQSFALPDGMRLILPVGRMETPDGQSFDREGLLPDVAVELTREQERRLALAGFGTEPRDDPVIQRALESLRRER
ncbi:MAG: S41 family peptidase [Verrucomicrobiae bacterium]|nr:S41 family peptidase [Verrucomicrobiae bacterium]